MSRDRAHARAIARPEPLEGRRLMAFDTFLHLGVPTGPIGAGTPNTVEVSPFSWGATGTGGGKVSVSTFDVAIEDEGAIAKDLLRDAAAGRRLPEVEVVERKADGSKSLFLTYNFTDAYVESIQVSGSAGGDDTPTEAVSFGFKSVSVVYAAGQGQASGGPISLETGSSSLDLKKKTAGTFAP